MGWALWILWTYAKEKRVILRYRIVMLPNLMSGYCHSLTFGKLPM